MSSSGVSGDIREALPRLCLRSSRYDSQQGDYCGVYVSIGLMRPLRRWSFRWAHMDPVWKLFLSGSSVASRSLIRYVLKDNPASLKVTGCRCDVFVTVQHPREVAKLVA